MGAFGTGSFDNDAALDWVESFKARKSCRAVTAAVEKAAGEEDPEVLIAAAEIVAALRGHPAEGLDPEIDEWADKQRRKGLDTGDLSRTAAHKLSSLKDRSELADLWRESDSYTEWCRSVDELIARLTAPALPADQKLPRRPPIVECVGSSMAVTTLKLTPGNRVKFSTIAPHTRSVRVNFAQDFTESERTLLLELLRQHPHIGLEAHDYPHRKAFRLRQEDLVPYDHLSSLEIRSDTLTSLAFLERFERLEALRLGPIPAVTTSLAAVGACSNLRKLTLYLLTDPQCEGLDRLATLPLEEIEIQPGIYSYTIGQSVSDNASSLPRLALDWLMHCPGLKKLVLRNFSTRTEHLNLGTLSDLSHLEVLHAVGLNTVTLPVSVAVVAVQGGGGTSMKFSGRPAALRQLVLDDSATLESVEMLRFAAELAAISIAGSSAAELETIRSLPSVVSLHLFAPKAPVLDLSKMTRLRFLQLFDCSLEAALNMALTAPGLEELVYFSGIDNQVALTDFEPLRRCSDLKYVSVTGFAPFTRAELASFLRLDVDYEPQDQRFVAAL